LYLTLLKDVLKILVILVHSPNAAIIGKEAKMFLHRNLDSPRGLMPLTRRPLESVLMDNVDLPTGATKEGSLISTPQQVVNEIMGEILLIWAK
jgi:hypothetical protein